MCRSQQMFPKTKEGLIRKWKEGVFSSQKGVAQSHVSEKKKYFMLLLLVIAMLSYLILSYHFS